MSTGEIKQDNEIYLTGNRMLVWLSGHDVSKIEQYEFAAMGGDEVALMSGDLVMRCAARVRHPKAGRLRIGYVGTPHYGWLKDVFDGKNDSMHRIIHASTTDNFHLPKNAVENLLASCPARMRKAYIDGYFVPLGGGVYPVFDEGKHAIMWEYDHRLQTGCAIDWSALTPAVLFVQILPKDYKLNQTVLPEGGMVIIDEMHPDGSTMSVTTERLCHLIKAKGYRLDFAVVDPAGKGTQSTSGMDDITIARQILNTRIMFKDDPKLRLIQNGIEHVKRMLEPVGKPPMLYFSADLLESQHPRCVIPAIRAYSYPVKKEGKDQEEKPIKDGITDHAMDLVRYLAINFFPVVRLQSRVRSIA